MKRARYSLPEVDSNSVDIVDCIKDALTGDVERVYECVLEIYTLCKKTVTDKDIKIRSLFELKGEYEKKIKNLEDELHASRVGKNSKNDDSLLKKSLIERNNIQKRLDESEQCNIKGEILLEKSKEQITALEKENLELKSQIEESNKNTTWMNVRIIQEKENELKLIRYKMEDEVNALKKKLVEKEDDNRAINEKLQLKEKEMEAMSLSFKNEMIQNTEKETFNLKRALDHVTQSFQKDRKTLTEMIRKKDQRNLERKAALEKLYDENKELNSKIDKLQSEKEISSESYMQLQNRETELKLTQLQENMKCLKEVNELLNQEVQRSTELYEVEKQSSSDSYMKLMENDITISRLNQDVSNTRLEMISLQKEIENLKKEVETTSKKLQKKKDQLKDEERKSSERRMRVKKLEKEVSRQRVEFKEVFERKRQKQYNKLTAKLLQVLMDGYNGLSEKITQKSVSKEEVGKTSASDKKEDSVKSEHIEKVCLDDNKPMTNTGPTTDRQDGDSVEQTVNAVMVEVEHFHSQILEEISSDVKQNEKQTSYVVSEVLCDVLGQVVDGSVDK